MKRSNLIFILLIVSLFSIPLLLNGFNSLFHQKSYTGISDEYTVIRIDNPELQASAIYVDTTETSAFPKGDVIDVNKCSYLFYKGSEQYLPEVSVKGDELLIGKARNTAGKEEKLTLHIHIGNVKTVLLNGKMIWSE